MFVALQQYWSILPLSGENDYFLSEVCLFYVFNNTPNKNIPFTI